MQDDDFTHNSEHFTERHWSKISEQYRQAGYREGIAAGKDREIQRGFDDAFNSVAVDARRIGRARGLANSLLQFLASQDINTVDTNTVRSIVKDLATVSPKQLKQSSATSSSFDMQSILSTMDALRPTPLEQSLAQLVEVLTKLDMVDVLWELDARCTSTAHRQS